MFLCRAARPLTMGSPLLSFDTTNLQLLITSGFQWVDDGRPLSFFGILVSAVLLAAGLSTLSYDLTMSLFGGLLGQVPYESVYLYGVYFIAPLACILIYLIAQIVLVAGNLGDQKPLSRANRDSV